MKSKLLKIIGIGFLFLLLALVRVFENELFYDPFIQFYKQLHYINKTPNYSLTNLLIHTFFRYSINSLLSILILLIAFRKRDIMRFTIIFYTVLFFVLISFYTVILLNFTEEFYKIFFYVRRFLIQPIFILLLLPAFYYQQKITPQK